MARTVRIKKPDELKELDFYQTCPSMVRALTDKLDMGKYILDPCAGKRVIGNELRKFGKVVEEWDIDPKHKEVHYMDFTQFEALSTWDFDCIVMNPPYSNKYVFIDQALGFGIPVYVLLPLDTSNYNIFHEQYLDVPHYSGRLLMTPKVKLHTGTETIRGGNTSYAWYHYDPVIYAEQKYEIYANLKEYGL